MDADRRFWLTHAIWPLLLFALIAAVCATTSLDESIERAWAVDPATGHFIGNGAGTWWAKALIHRTGGAVMRGLGALLLLLWHQDPATLAATGRLSDPEHCAGHRCRCPAQGDE
jgi:hypothetical protein